MRLAAEQMNRNRSGPSLGSRQGKIISAALVIGERIDQSADKTTTQGFKCGSVLISLFSLLFSPLLKSPSPLPLLSMPNFKALQSDYFSSSTTNTFQSIASSSFIHHSILISTFFLMRVMETCIWEGNENGGCEGSSVEADVSLEKLKL